MAYTSRIGIEVILKEFEHKSINIISSHLFFIHIYDRRKWIKVT